MNRLWIGALWLLAGCGAVEDMPGRGAALEALPDWQGDGAQCGRPYPVGACIDALQPGWGEAWVGEGVVTAAGRGARRDDCRGFVVGKPLSGVDETPYGTWFDLTDADGQTRRIVFGSPAPLDVRVGDTLRVEARRQSAEPLYTDGGELVIEDARGLVGFVAYWSEGAGVPGLSYGPGEVACEAGQARQLRMVSYQTDVTWAGEAATLARGEVAQVADLVVFAAGAQGVSDPDMVSHEGCHACTFVMGFSAARAID